MSVPWNQTQTPTSTYAVPSPPCFSLPSRDSPLTLPILAANVVVGLQAAEFLGVLCAIMESICSSVRPFISGTRKYANANDSTHNDPQIKNTRGPRSADPGSFPTIYGVITAMIQFQNQFAAVDRPTPRERIGSGKHSPTMTQPTGPQVAAKKKM